MALGARLCRRLACGGLVSKSRIAFARAFEMFLKSPMCKLDAIGAFHMRQYMGGYLILGGKIDLGVAHKSFMKEEDLCFCTLD
jgi:hypothetical protein